MPTETDDKKSKTAKSSMPTGKGPNFDPETEKPWGVDPETDELVSVTPGGLKAVYGLSDAAADELYCKIAGVNQGSVWFNPQIEPTSYRPPLNIGSLTGKVKEKVEKILSEVKGKE